MECEFLQDDIDFLTWMETTSNTGTSNMATGQKDENGILQEISVENEISESEGPTQDSPVFISPLGDPHSIDTLNFGAFPGSSASDALLKVERQKNRILKSKNLALRRNLFVLRQSSKRRLVSNFKTKQKLLKVTAELKDVRMSKSLNESLGEQARKNPIIQDTLINSTRKPHARRYHPETMKFASSTYLSGPRTYRFMRSTNKIVLPHKTSVYRYNKHIRIKPGLNDALLRAIKRKVKHFKVRKDKVVVVSCDGMSVKPELSYCAKADVFHGFPDDGEIKKIEKNRTTALATEAVTVMVSGMYRSFKQVIQTMK